MIATADPDRFVHARHPGPRERQPDRIASQIVERQNALRAEVRIVAGWPQRRRTPVTGLATQEIVSLIGIAAATGRGSRRVVGVEATGINACPCAQDLVRGSAAERLAEAGFGDDVEPVSYTHLTLPTICSV